MLQIKSKYKIAKRLGAQIFEQTQTQKFALVEARVKKPRGGGRGGKTDYGRQLLEKQKVRFTYGIAERQLSNYAAAAFEEKLPPEAFAPRARAAPRQRCLSRRLCTHAPRCPPNDEPWPPSRERQAHHDAVVPPQKGDAISVREGSRKSTLFFHMTNPEAAARAIPHWLSVDASTLVAKVEGEPAYVAAEIPLDYPAVFEFYSR